ncbi:MAG TPA: PHP domain-containing protein [Candidatus Brocadiia bacterium]|nr:PHP domain-containing protein [Candidatus Brocadiia bacterium]
MKTDLHVHSNHSKRPSIWFLQKIGCPESFTEPERIYSLARDRGMNWVTIADHNTIDGALAIAHLPRTFISEEVTTYFPEDGCKIHVLVNDITERQHEEIQAVRPSIYDLVRYLREQRVFHAVAHPLSPVNGRLTLDHVEKMLLLFKRFELNSDQNPLLNTAIRRIASNLTPCGMERLARLHNLEPQGEQPWVKRFVAGSDDHCSLTIGRGFVHAAGAQSPAELFEAVDAGRARAVCREATPRTTAHNLYAIAWQFYRRRLGLGRYAQADPLVLFLDRCFLSQPEAERGLVSKLYFAWSQRRGWRGRPAEGAGLGELLQYEARRLLREDPRIGEILRDGMSPGVDTERVSFRFISEIADKLVRHVGADAAQRFSEASIFSLFHSIGSAGALFLLLAPCFVAYNLFASQRRFALEALESLAGHTPAAAERVACLAGADNPAAFAATEQAVAGLYGPSAEVAHMVCATGVRDGHGFRVFQPAGVCSLGARQITPPPLLEMLDALYEGGFTALHCDGAGPLGLAAVVVGRILGLPLSCAPPGGDGGALGDDDDVGGLLKRYGQWFLGQMDKVAPPGASPTPCAGRELLLASAEN